MEERTTTAIKKMTGQTASTDVSKFAESYASFNRIVNSLQRQYIELKEEFTAQNLEVARTNLKLVRLTKSNLAATEFLNGVLNSVPIGVITVNQNSVITHCNPTAMAIFGIAEKSVIGRKYSEVIKTGHGQSAVSAVRTFKTGEEFSATEQKITLADNRELNLSISTAKLEDESGKFVGAVEVIQDMTKVRRLEQEIARLNTLAALGEMAAVIAHEVRNPLSGISGFASLLERDLADDDPKMKLVLKIKRGAEILNETVTRLLNYTRFSELNRTDSSYLKYLESIIEDFNTQLAEAGKQTKVDFNFPEYLARRNVIISLDQILFRQALYNILTNAVEAMDDSGKLTVEIMTYEANDTPELFKNKLPLEFGEQLLVTTISDSGQGIEAEPREKIFAPFFTTKKDGSGLGLAVAWKLVKAHGGEILLAEKQQEGTTFHILLPAKIDTAQSEN